MRIIAVDDEQIMLAALCSAIKEAEPEAELACFDEPDDAAAYIRNNCCDIAFLDIKMRGMTGIELAVEMKKYAPEINVIFTTGYSEYAVKAFELRCSGYLMKPVTGEEVKKELSMLRNPIIKKTENSLIVHTFGNFEVFLNGLPLIFESRRAKEIFAYLIDRKGAAVTNAELAAVLWDGVASNKLSLQASVRKTKAKLIGIFKENKIEDCLIINSETSAVNVNKIECDYFRLLSGDINALNSFSNEYMTNYSWAEFTLGNLMQITPK